MAYNKGLVDIGVISLADVKKEMAKDKKAKLKYSKSNRHNQYIDDTIAELQNWHIFNQPNTTSFNIPNKSVRILAANKPFVQDQKIGRNDPCICGSGKKYKKCCGAAS